MGGGGSGSGAADGIGDDDDDDDDGDPCGNDGDRDGKFGNGNLLHTWQHAALPSIFHACAQA